MLLLRRPAALAAATLLLLTAGCSSGGGSGDGDDAAQPGTTAATPSRTAPPPTADAELLASAPGRAIDAWAAAYARAVNKGDRTFAGATDATAPAVRDWMERHAGAEWGRYFPGPLPVAPLGARPVDDTHRDVEACVLVSGWTQESRTVRRTRSRAVAGVTFRLVSAPAGWRVDRISSAEIDCRDVVPPTRTW
ncbi:hypothetical protein [Nocardioides daeguensis]|uniref:Lipoprotein n=1 Tax=Nocardioides daeguensis TaxID=908359 RepID=A0ABP6WM69_9ACTN|nr:hypothetical protein [Nocardioides daeguensis]MBV6726572.1 hypothetical protein [Nocardioides daeguensis]MCR1772415.1 hypothetical protein [Nocardioides daeguensis]